MKCERHMGESANLYTIITTKTIKLIEQFQHCPLDFSISTYLTAIKEEKWVNKNGIGTQTPMNMLSHSPSFWYKTTKP